MIDMPFENAQVTCFIGAPQTGRTFSLVQEAAEQVRKGASVLYVCARARDVAGVCARLRAVGVPVASTGCLATDVGSSDSARGRSAASDVLAAAGSGCGGQGVRAEKACGWVRVATCADIALGILRMPEARAQFGRKPRLLEPYEESVLLEDLKVSQMKNRRLRKVLAYLHAGWSNLSDDAWEQTAEEDLVISRLRANLRFTGGVLRCEASNFAVHVLREHERARKAASYDCLLVDDFELLSRASQHLVRLLARRALVVASAERPGLPGDEEHPCFAGTQELLEVAPGAQVVKLRDGWQAPGVRQVLAGLCADDALKPLVDDTLYADCSVRAYCDSSCAVAAVCDGLRTAQLGSSASCAGEFGLASDAAEPFACDGAPSHLHMEPSLEAELRALAVASSGALERGESVLIVGANRLWRRNVVANLRRVGLPIEEMPASGAYLKDFLDERQCRRVQADALQRLAVDSEDSVAWRTLIALGDSVARSAAVDYLRRWAKRDAPDGGSVDLYEALKLLAAGQVSIDGLAKPLLDDLLSAYERTKNIVDAVGASGGAVAPDGSLRGSGVPDGALGNGSSLGAALRGGVAPRFVSGVGVASEEAVNSAAVKQPMPGAICVAAPDQVSGLRFDTVIFGGFVNGLIPCRAYCDPVGMASESRAREHAKDARMVYGVASCARARVMFTGFATCSLQAAETMDVHIQSIKLRHGIRTVTTQPSELSVLLS